MIKTGLRYCEKYDVWVDENDNFLEKRCSDPNCEYCGKRPNKHPDDCQFDYTKEEIDRQFKIVDIMNWLNQKKEYFRW